MSCDEAPGCRICLLFAAPAALLNRRTLDRPERAEHAAITGIRTQERLAVAALVEELAGLRRHRLHFLETAFRASDHGFEDNGAQGTPPFTSPERASSAAASSESSMKTRYGNSVSGYS